MSVLRPSGPLPPRVYWTRRLLLLVVVAVVVAVLWWVTAKVAGGTEETPGADAPVSVATTSQTTGAGPETTAPETSTAPSTTAAPSTTTAPETTSGPGGPTATGNGGGGTTGSGQPDEQETSTTPPLPDPTGYCDPTDVDMEISVSDAEAGVPTSAVLVLRSIQTEACTLPITPESLALRVTSGDDVIWSSDQCPDELLAKEIVVRQDPAAEYRFRWNGRRSTETCNVDGRRVGPGGYWIEAALIGGDPHRAYFDLT